MMKSLALTVGSFSLIWVYLLTLSIIQIILCNHKNIFIGISIAIIVGNLLFFWIVFKHLKFKEDSSRNKGLKSFSNIYEDRKIGVEFIIANLLPLMTMELFSKVEIATFFNNVIMLLILFIIVNHSQSFAFNPYLYALKYRIYRTKDDDELILLMRKSDFGNKADYQKKLQFEEFDNSKIFIVKKGKVNQSAE